MADFIEVWHISHSHIHMFRDDAWLSAVEPIHTDKPDIAGIGLCTSFAHERVTRFPNMQVDRVPTTVGGTTLSRWMPDADLYENAFRLKAHSKLS